MKFIDFFAGIGGFRRGMELAGHECVGFCEIDKYAVMSYTAMHLITEEQREYLATLDLRTRQKEILKDEYRNGEWYASDISRVDARDLPHADCWCFGFPCQDISVAGKQVGFEGNRSSLFFRVMYLLGQLPSEERPTYLFIENVKNLLSVNGGWDFARLLVELDRGGYDAEWQTLDSKNFNVPQHRERVFIVGRFRGRGRSEVLPVPEPNGENCVHQIGMDGTSRRKNHNQYRLYGVSGLSPTLNKMDGGGREPHIPIPVVCLDPKYKCLEGGMREYEEETPTLTSRDYKDPLQVIVATDNRSKENNGGVYAKVADGTTVYAIWYAKQQRYVAIRKLTPKECFRLQGWSDDYFHKAELMNSNSQLYKQAGNGVTVNVIRAVAEKMKGESKYDLG